MAVVSLGIIGSAAGSGASLTIPVTTNVPRSDPTAGASIIVVTLISDDGGIEAGIASIGDDASIDAFYGTCLVADGLNSYVESPIGVSTSSANMNVGAAWFGLITNPLVGGTNSITVTPTTPQSYLFAFATAYTGVNVDYVGPGGFVDASFMFTGGIGAPENPIGEVGCAGAGDDHLVWSLTPGVTILNPSACSAADWEWKTGELALYWLLRFDPFDTSGGWTWTDTDIVTQDEWDDVVGITNNYSLVFAEQAIVAPQGGIDLSGTWATAVTGASGGGGILIAGPGPTCTTPPVFGGPVFNHRHRATFASEAP